jgi:hypothetical protein
VSIKYILEDLICTVLSFVKYAGCLRNTVYQDPLHLYNYATKKCVYFNCLKFYDFLLCATDAILFLCGVVLI